MDCSLCGACLLILLTSNIQDYDRQVSFYTFIPPLASSIMAPSLPEIGRRYGIESPTIIALTLSIFLVSFGIGVSNRLAFIFTKI